MSTTTNETKFTNLKHISLLLSDEKYCSATHAGIRTSKKQLEKLYSQVKNKSVEKLKQIEKQNELEDEQNNEVLNESETRQPNESDVSSTLESLEVNLQTQNQDTNEVANETIEVEKEQTSSSVDAEKTEKVEKSKPIKVESEVVQTKTPEKKPKKTEKKPKAIDEKVLSQAGLFTSSNNRLSIDLSKVNAPPKPDKPNINSRFIQNNNNTRVKKEGFMSDYNRNRPQTPKSGAPNKKPSPKFVAPAVIPTVNTNTQKKKSQDRNFEQDKKLNKKALINKGFVDISVDYEDRMGSKLKVRKKQEVERSQNTIKIEKAVVNSQIIPLKVLSEKLAISATALTKRLFKEGIIKTINESIDYDTAAFIALDMGIELELKLEMSAEDKLNEVFKEDISEQNLETRPPVVTVMGHVDHGKTSLLDYIRKAKVVDGEAGGITQHIGAYSIKVKDRAITFIDTPGHEAFTSMRARGAQVTDISILVVAGDDGVMPQTIESIKHSKAAGVPLIVAVNKMDKPNTNIERIKQQLSENDILPEEWGGDTMIMPVSALTGMGVDELLDSIVLLADVKELKADKSAQAKGTIIEAKLDKGKGAVATVLIQNGTLKIGDSIICGTCSGRIRAMFDHNGKSVKKAEPSFAVSVLGFDEVPTAGDIMYAVEGNLSKQIIQERIAELKQNMIVESKAMTLEEITRINKESQLKILNIIIKADVQGSAEALKQAISKIENEEVKANVVFCGVGAVNETDVNFAITTNATILCFNTKPDANSKVIIDRNKVEVKSYRIIYQAIDDITSIVEGMKTPKYREVILGKAEVRVVMKLSSGVVAGSYVLDGKMVRSAKLRLIRNNEIKFEGKFAALKRFKDDVKEVGTNYECGITLEGFSDIKELDILQCYEMELIK